MSRHWNPHGTRWLSDSDYRALSPQARRALHFERALVRHERRFRPTQARYRKSHFARELQKCAAALVVLGLAATQVDFTSPHLGDPASASVPAPVRASFSYCYTGAGTDCVVDGDTFWIGGEKVRIAGIDAPETHPSRCDYEAQLGNAATERLHDLLNSGAVTMTSIDRDRDVYGRLLRNVQVNGADVGEAMVSAGVARAYAGGRRPWC